jgi:hypothetical protein
MKRNFCLNIAIALDDSNESRFSIENS